MDTFVDALGKIDWRLVATLTIAPIVAVIGWFFVHRLNAERDLTVRRREARIKALESAFLRLATSSNKKLTDTEMDAIEMFVSELQLYGTPRQVELMGQIVEGLKKPNNTVVFDSILIDLRDTIRNELRLERLPPTIWWFRFNRKTGKVVQSTNDG